MSTFSLAGAVSTHLACALCGGRSGTVVGTRGREGNALRSVACQGCGLVWSDPRPHDTRQFYEQDYRRAYKGTFEPRPKHVLRAGRVALGRRDRILDLLRPGQRVLDVGSGGGEFSYLLTQLGQSVTGVEPNVGYAEYAMREYPLNIVRGFIGEAPLAPASFDLVTIWHVLEHTDDPAAVLRRLREVLVPGGMLVVEVPNIEATCQSPRSTFHDAHLYHFNVATLKALASRCALEEVRHALSADGGNLTMVFRAVQPAAQGASGGALSGNHDRVVTVLAGHQSRRWRHFVRPGTGLRALRRLGSAIDERLTLRDMRGLTGKALLDPLYGNALSPDKPVGALSAWRFGGLALAALAAAWWLAAELADRVQDFALSPGEGMAVYFTVQAAVLSLVWLGASAGAAAGPTRRLRLGGLGVMLASIPVMH